LYSDKLFSTDTTVFIDDFGKTRQLNWNVRVEQDDVWKTTKRKSDTELKFTADTLPYTIGSYKNENVLIYTNKFDFTNPNAFSGSNAVSNVGVGDNHGLAPFMYMTDISSTVFEISTEFIFDKEIINTDYLKQFELILKAEEHFSAQNNNYGITDFYFVGPGVYNFDVGLGMRSIDLVTGEVKETFLASWGDFNVRNIKADVWYKMTAKVSPTNIKIFFHQRNEDPELILSYNIDRRNEKITDRYLKGEFETLQSLIIGLSDLGITYPENLGDTVSKDYTFKNFKEEFAATLPINGFYSGFRLHNDMTYVAKVTYGVSENKVYKFGSAMDVSPQDSLLQSIFKKYAVVGDVVKIRKTLNFYTLIQIDDKLFYSFAGQDVVKYDSLIEQFEVVGDKVVIVEKTVLPDSLHGMMDLSGTATYTWVLTDTTTNIITLSDLATQINHVESVVLKRNGVEIAQYPTLSAGVNPILALNDELTITIEPGYTSMFFVSGNLGVWGRFVRVFLDGLVNEYPVMVKDKTFYNDNLQSYMEFSQKNIRQVVINDGVLHIIFQDN
jgi:hypothetical protein